MVVVRQPIPEEAELKDTELLAILGAGNDEAVTVLFNRYAARLRSVAKAKLSPGLAGRLDADDIVQSVFRRFLQAARTGRYHLPSGQELWDLLIVFTLNRLRTAELHHRAGKRDIRQTVPWKTDPPSGRDDPIDGALSVVVEEALDRLPAHYREALWMRVEGYEVAEIADRMNCSKRTIERILQEARTRLQSLLQ